MRREKWQVVLAYKLPDRFVEVLGGLSPSPPPPPPHPYIFSHETFQSGICPCASKKKDFLKFEQMRLLINEIFFHSDPCCECI